MSGICTKQWGQGCYKTTDNAVVMWVRVLDRIEDLKRNEVFKLTRTIQFIAMTVIGKTDFGSDCEVERNTSIRTLIDKVV